MSNAILQRAKDTKNDEFYTQLEDIAAEVSIYRDRFADKSIYLPNDYDGIMGVAVTAIGKINPEQFDIIDKRRDLYLYGVQKFERLLIKWRKEHD